MMDYEIYDFNALINRKQREDMIGNISSLIASGNYWTNSPKYQTNINIFGHSGEHWCNLKMSFIYSCFAFLKQEVKIHNIQSWAYQTCLSNAEDRNNLWHHHNHNPQTKTISGIFYLHVPMVEDFEKAGTEFAPLGLENSERLWIKPQIGKWLIYPGSIWHRPGILQSDENRYIVAADLEF